MTNVTILGMGKLGLPMAALYASVGHKVVGIDLDETLIERLQSGTFRTDEPEVNDLLTAHAERLTFERLPAEAILKAEIVFVVVPTPSKADGTFDGSFVVRACQQIGTALHDKKAYTLVVIVSTLMPGQMDSDVVPVLERTSGKKAGAEFGVCYSPEFIALGRVIAGLRYPDYVLIGANEVDAAARLQKFYATVTSATAKWMGFVNAELAKLATNAYLSLKIAYANVLGQICEQLPGANVDVVTQAVGADHRIGTAYLRAGLPPAGPCLPRDLVAISKIEKNDFFSSLPLLNQTYFRRIARQIEHRLSRTDRIAVLGTAYSTTSALETGSWGYALEHELRDSGYDVEFCKLDEDAQDIVDRVDVVILTLPLDSYRALKFHTPQVLIDLWRVFDERPENVDQFIRLGVGATSITPVAMYKGELTTLSVPIEEYDGGFDGEDDTDV